MPETILQSIPKLRARKRKPNAKTVIHRHQHNYEMDTTAAVKILDEIREQCARAEILIRQLREERAKIYSLGVVDR
jgi:hypothetical protein